MLGFRGLGLRALGSQSRPEGRRVEFSYIRGLRIRELVSPGHRSRQGNDGRIDGCRSCRGGKNPDGRIVLVRTRSLEQLALQSKDHTCACITMCVYTCAYTDLTVDCVYLVVYCFDYRT